MGKQYYIYLLTNPTNTVIYTGVTNNLIRRVYEHRHHKGSSFTSRYNLVKLVHYEVFDNPVFAIEREKQIKGGSRIVKEKLIKTNNPNYDDLY